MGLNSNVNSDANILNSNVTTAEDSPPNIDRPVPVDPNHTDKFNLYGNSVNRTIVNRGVFEKIIRQIEADLQVQVLISQEILLWKLFPLL